MGEIPEPRAFLSVALHSGFCLASILGCCCSRTLVIVLQGQSSPPAELDSGLFNPDSCFGGAAHIVAASSFSTFYNNKGLKLGYSFLLSSKKRQLSSLVLKMEFWRPSSLLKSFLETFFCVIFSPNLLEKGSNTWTLLHHPLTKVRLLNIWRDASAGPSAKVEHIPHKTSLKELPTPCPCH